MLTLVITKPALGWRVAAPCPYTSLLSNQTIAQESSIFTPEVNAAFWSSLSKTPFPEDAPFSLGRMKRAQFGPHDWLSLPVPAGSSWLLVDTLEPETAYQFSVLAQNKLGTSSFSEVVTVNTLGRSSMGTRGGIREGRGDVLSDGDQQL